jgi:NAD(P)-dependent dehydrogenase (short-subunit alcohol dehydrogenase family)
MVAGSALGQSEASGNSSLTGLMDPQTRYTKEPFPEQNQEWPALQREMKPVPDSGEKSYRGSGRLAGRKALITGGDSGIGRAAAIAFAREGADVAINYYPTEEPDAQDLLKLMQAEGKRIVLLLGDLTDREFCVNLVGQANRKLGGIDIPVNNAAYQQSKSSIEEISFNQFDRTLKTNLYAMFYITKTAVPLMKPGSVIINTASANSVDPGEELLDYATTKGGIAIFAKGLAKQLAKKGIRVNAVAPGPIWTPLQVAGGQLPGTLGEFGQDTPLGRAGQPAELAGLYVALASSELSYTDGSIFGANGGTGTI